MFSLYALNPHPSFWGFLCPIGGGHQEDVNPS